MRCSRHAGSARRFWSRARSPGLIRRGEPVPARRRRRAARAHDHPATGRDMASPRRSRASNRSFGMGIYYGAARSEAARYPRSRRPHHRRRQLGRPGGALFSNHARHGDDRSAAATRSRRACPSISWIRSRRKSNIEILLVLRRSRACMASQARGDRLSDPPPDVRPRPTAAACSCSSVPTRTAWLPPESRSTGAATCSRARTCRERPLAHDRDPYLLETSVPGIFAWGDVRFEPGQARRSGGRRREHGHRLRPPVPAQRAMTRPRTRG